jgi:hypothetical protein
MTELASIEPELIYAGETVEWYRSFSDYPATEYTLKYYLNGPAAITLTAAAYQTTDHKITVASAGTGGSSTWAFGIYSWQAYAEKGSGDTIEKYFIGSGFLTVKTVAGKSHAKKVLDAIEALMEGRTVSDVENYTIAGRSLTKMSVDDLIKWRNKYKAEYLAEQANENRIQGKASGNRILMRFRQPS